MTDPRALLKEIAPKFLSARARQYKWGTYDGTIQHNMLGAEVRPAPQIGLIIAHQDGWYVQKTGISTFALHLESLIGEPMNIGDKVEIQHGGFAGLLQEEVPREEGMHFKSTRLSRRELTSPVNFPQLNDMVRQLSEMKLPDGRRGLHMLSDLKFENFKGDASEKFNPYVEFNVTGAKFKGLVRIEYIWGADVYEIHFGEGNNKTVYDNVYCMEMLETIENHCDSSPARLATVKVLAKAKKPKAEKSSPAAQPMQPSI